MKKPSKSFRVNFRRNLKMVVFLGDLCYNKNINELSDFEIAVGVIGIYEEKMLEKISKRNEVLKGISDMLSVSFEDDVVAFDLKNT